MQTINSFRERLAFHRNCIAEFNRRVFVSARAPNFAVRNEATPNFSPVHQRAVVFDRDIRQRNALFGLGSLANIGQLQIALCGSDLAEPENGETKSEWLKRDCFHIVAVTLPKFSILRYQIIHRFQNGRLDPPDSAFPAKSRSQRDVSLSQRKKHKNCRGPGFCHSERKSRNPVA